MNRTGAPARAHLGRNKVTYPPEWEDRLDRICKLTLRTSLILELFGLDPEVDRERLKEAIDRRYSDMGGDMPPRPRGQPASHQSTNFLESMAERYDAAYLLALHYPHGPGEFAETEFNLGRAVDKLMDTFEQYRVNLYPAVGAFNTRVTFETFCELVKGVRAGGIEVHICKDCGSRHPVNVVRLGNPPCPICHFHKPKFHQLRREFENRRKALALANREVQLRAAHA